MEKRFTLLAGLWLAILSLSAASPAAADELSQNFETWTVTPVTLTNAGWSFGASNVLPTVYEGTSSRGGAGRSMRFDRYTTNAYLALPYVTNGAGAVTFYSRTSILTNFNFESSSNGTTWQTLFVQKGTGTPGATYYPYTFNITQYGSNYYRIYIPGAASLASGTLFIDDVSLTQPIAKVQVDSANATTAVGSSDIFTGDPVNITAAYTPFGPVSNLAMTLYYRAGLVAPTNQIGMTNIGGNAYMTTSPIPGQAAGKVYYYVRSTFFGSPTNNAASPTNYPYNGFTNNSLYYTVATRTYATQNGSLITTGTLASTLSITKDYEWESFVSYTGTTFSFQFQGVSNATTRNWGDANQSGMTPPLEQGADLSAASIQVTPSTNVGQVVIRFKEQTAAYVVKEAAVETFDSWAAAAFGTYTNSASWVLMNGMISNSVDLRLRNGYAMLESNTVAGTTVTWLRSPYLPQGIGEVSLWLRNNNSNGVPTTGAIIEKSITGGTNDIDWVRIASTNALGVLPFQRLTTVLSDRTYHYVRIRNSTNFPNSRLCLDEVLIAQPAAGVQFSGTTNSPSAPSATNPVAISSTITSLGNASNLSAKIWYRSGSTGAWSSIAMTNTGSAFTTLANIPAGKGDKPGGSGTVQYYLECGFQGIESSFTTPFIYPESASNAPLSYQISQATIQLSNPVTEPAQPVVESTTRLGVDAALLNGASNLSLTAYYRLNGSGGYTPLVMSLLSNGTYRTTGSIPAQSVSGTLLEYYFSAAFLGAEAASPTNYPVNAPASVFSATFRPIMQNDSMSVTGGLSSAMFVSEANLWETFIPYTGATFGVQFQGVSNGTPRTWGDSNQSSSAPPFTLNADLSAGAIQIAPTTNTGTLLFRFQESTRNYTIKQAVVQRFDSWDAPAIGNSTDSLWTVSQGMTASNSLVQLRGRYLVLESNTTSWIVSPSVAGGIGEISFWHRNLNSSDTPAAGLVVEKSTTGGTNAAEWVFLAAVTNISYTQFTRYTLVHPDRNSFYVRVRTSTNRPNARIALDDLVIAQPGAGVTFSSVTNSPASPAASNTVAISATLTPAGNASNLSAKVWYRSGTTGAWAWVTTTKSGNTFTSAAIPAGIGDKSGGAGLVQYYLECSYLGYESALSSPLFYPSPGSIAPLSYTVQSSWLLATNATTEPTMPIVGGSTRLRIDLLPQAGASNITAFAWYRFGGAGTYASNSMARLSNDTFQTTADLPEQTLIGQPLDYYFTLSFGGPDPATPTNSPANAPTAVYRTIYHAQAWTSAYSAVTITGDLVRAMTPFTNQGWRAILTVTNKANAQFRFAGAGAGAPVWRDQNQTATALPLYGTAETSGSDILMTGTVSATLLFQFSETDLSYSGQRASYSDLTTWPTSNAWTTNATGWVLNGRAGRTNDPSDSQRIFEGPFLVLQGGSATNFLRSPAMTNGIGEVSFFYRNWYDDGSRPVSFVVEGSPTNNSTTNGWTTLDTVTNLLSADYRFFTLVLPDIWTNRYIRIRNTSPATTDRLCIDETVVSDGGASVLYSNVTYTPSSPSIMDEVTISAGIYPRAGAAAITPILWYKATTNASAYYEYAAMTNVSANVYQATIPRGPIGPMYYYIQSGYSGFFSDKTSPQYFPGPAAALSYSNADASFLEGFETWPDKGAVLSSFTNGEWSVYNSYCRGDGNFAGAPGSTNRAIFLKNINYLSLSGGTSLLTPVLTNLYGTVSLTFMMNVIASSSRQTIGIWTTYETNPVVDITLTNTWTKKTSVTNTAVANTWFLQGPIEFTNNNFRILLIKEEGNYYVGIDQVEIAQRSAMITFSNLFLNPGYPGTNESVQVSYNIDSLLPGMPAYNLQPFLYYRPAGSGTFSGPYAMGRASGNRRFTNSIPASLAVLNSNTEFYVTCQYDGYYHSASLIKSPMVSETNTFTPRLKPSDYGRMFTSGNRGTLQMELLDDYLWQAIINLETNVSGMTFNFSGFEQFTGFGFSSGVTNWGQPGDQWKTNLPLADTAISTNYTSIIAAGQMLGQYVARIQERTAQFTLQACVFQNFEKWPTTADYFMLSGESATETYTNNFNDWPTNVVRSQYDDFDNLLTWTNKSGTHGINYYTNDWYDGYAGWGIDGGMVTNTVGFGSTYGVMLRPDANLGRVMNSQGGTVPLEGVGTISFWYKVLDTNIPTTLKVNLAPIGSHKIPSSWETIATLTNFTDGLSNNFIMAVNTSAYKSIVLEHADGVARVAIDNVKFTDFAASYIETNGWKASEVWMQAKAGRTGLTNDTAIEFDGRRFNTNAFLTTPLMTNGVGFFEFYYRTTNALPVSFDVFFLRGSGEAVTTEKIASVTNSPANYLLYSLVVMTNAMGYISVVPTSTNRLFIDNVRITGVPSATSWEANNARISDDSNCVFRGMPVYLNDGVANILTNMCNTQEWPYIKTPWFSHGIGEISFWYRNYATVNPTSGTLRVQTSVNGLSGNSNWTDVATLTNIMNTKAFLYFRTNLYDNSARYVRILNDTNQPSKSRIILDEVMVTQPMAADLRLTNLRVSPVMPVPTNDVHVYVDVRDLFLYPSNLALAVEYSVGTNYGSWSVTNSTAMQLISNNVLTGTATYRTTAPIPHQAADRFVFYQINAAFAGLNAAGHTSPKLGREFSTPSYYYPLNYGTNLPYYIVFSVASNAVWFNEIDPGNNPWGTTAHYYDFVELAGAQGIDISKWKLLFFSSVNATQALYSYTIPDSTLLPSTTNGIGFFLLAKSTISATPKMLLTNNIPYPGGVALQRPAGMYSARIAFANNAGLVSTLTTNGFTYIGADNDALTLVAGPRSICLVGTGSVSTAFTWRTTTYQNPVATPLAVNWLQTLVGSSSPVNAPPTDVQIVDFWFADQKIWLTVTGTNSWLPSPWFTTNLMGPGSWTNVSAFDRYGLNTTNWTYTLRFPIPSNFPAYFYKVVTTNAP